MSDVLTDEALKAERDALERQLSMSEAKCKGYFSDAAAALVRCDALLAENVRLKDAITTHSQSTHFCELCGMDDPCNTDDVCYALNETPATDAALAAIEARGVEKFADFLGKQYQCEKTNTAKGNAYKHVVFLACRFARELQEAK